MFTGLVEEIGKIKKVDTSGSSAVIEIEAVKVLEGVKHGDSIATNGVCLTVVDYTDTSFTVDVMPESIRLTNLKDITKGTEVNLERALRLGDRLGGHMVSGHIDGMGKIASVKEEDNATWLEIETGGDVLKYVIYKGSIAIDGTSLTVAELGERSFKVSIIPTTKDETTLLRKKIGDVVNLECDLIGKYVERLLSYREEAPKSRIDIDFLRENGFA
ncbi:riboflavin synthase [Andreesenia angusta]|uniref:Riboflavin synthase n=1 Tax=Andreesenia angusta TaxID=39480 RepID=A0A1S1V6K0_9FIRM|nr:riboflavin synthase [Andreesenia angusta]OHW62271.1 riboflavin synthase [Andreesenia angusta]